MSSSSSVSARMGAVARVGERPWFGGVGLTETPPLGSAVPTAGGCARAGGHGVSTPAALARGFVESLAREHCPAGCLRGWVGDGGGTAGGLWARDGAKWRALLTSSETRISTSEIINNKIPGPRKGKTEYCIIWLFLSITQDAGQQGQKRSTRSLPAPWRRCPRWSAATESPAMVSLASYIAQRVEIAIMIQTRLCIFLLCRVWKFTGNSRPIFI